MALMADIKTQGPKQGLIKGGPIHHDISSDDLATLVRDVGKDAAIHVNLSQSTISLVSERAGHAVDFKFRLANLERAKLLLERLVREATQGFPVTGADVREFLGLLDPAL
jgi:hypothetical protein